MVIIFVVSCRTHEEIDYSYESIEEVTKNLPSELKDRTQLRLAFGKALSKAFINQNFKQFIYSLSLEKEFEGYREVLLAQYIDKEFENGQTVRDHFITSFDSEVTSLFGTELINLLLTKDPLITIKIPDIFYHYDFSSPDVCPFVFVKTPLHLKGFDLYMSYYKSQYHELISSDEKGNYFGITIKYSEDYLLLDFDSKLNEKGIHLMELFPQITGEDWLRIKGTLKSQSIASYEHHGYAYIGKKNILKTYYESKEAPKNLIENNIDCYLICKRDCKKPENISTVLKSIELINGSPIYERDKSRLFLENYSMNLLVFDHVQDDNIRSYFGLHGIRFAELARKSYEHPKIQLELRCYKNIGEIILPVLHGGVTHVYNKPYLNLIDLEILNKWNPRSNSNNFGLLMYYSEYGDLINRELLNYYDQSTLVLNTSFYVPIGKKIISYCDDVKTQYNFGNSAITLSY